MTDPLDGMFPAQGGPRPGAAPRRACRRHEWEFTQEVNLTLGSNNLTVFEWCSRCHRRRDPAASRRGANNRKRGNAIELWACRLLGIRRVGQYGGADDGGDASDPFVVQVKSGGAYPERIDALLRALPSRAGQLRAVVHADAPGGGHARRALITLDLRDFCQWYGKGDGEGGDG